MTTLPSLKVLTKPLTKPNNLSAPVSEPPNEITGQSYGSQLGEICSVDGYRSHKGPSRQHRAASEDLSNHQPNPTTSRHQSQSCRLGSHWKAMGHSCAKSAVLVVIEVTKGHHDNAVQPQRTRPTTNQTQKPLGTCLKKPIETTFQ